jgi:hypothetical protein
MKNAGEDGAVAINVLVLVDVISSFERIRVIFLELFYFINIL